MGRQTSMISPERLKELLEKCTPGPWKPLSGMVYFVNAQDAESIVCTVGPEMYVTANESSSRHKLANQELIAIAPDLAREVLRLREAIASQEETKRGKI